MGDPLDTKLAISIKKTQDLLGKYVKKPPLSEKNLARPPFRFLHDVITTVINTTEFLNGILSPDETDSAKITTKEAKNAFMQKIINAISDATGEQLSVKVSKILAGQEPDKTNELLQALAKAIEKNGGAKQTAGGSKGKELAGTSKDKKPVTKAIPGKTDGLASRKPGPSGTKKVSTSSVKPKSEEKVKKTVRDPSPGTKNVDEKKGTGSRSGGKVSAPTTASDAKVSAPNMLDLGSTETETNQKENDNGINDSQEKSRKSTSVGSRGSALKRQNSSLRNTKVETVEPLDEAVENASISVGGGANEDIELLYNDQHVEMGDDFKSTYMNPNMETLTVPTSPIISDSSAMQLGIVPESTVIINNTVDNISVENPDKFGKPAISSVSGPSSGVANDDKMEFQDSFGETDLMNDAGPSNAQSRNRAGTSRASSSRPPSARPAPPRPRSSMFKEAEESNYRPTTGKVSNVLLDSSDMQDDDDNFVIRETVSKALGLADLDEAPELTLTSGADVKHSDQIDEFLPPEQRGLLVNQILETQKELEDKENDKNNMSELPVDRSKSREVTLAEIEKLKNLIQGCARSANPLGKLLDYVREDMDAMQKELSKWRDESRQLDVDLESTKQATEASLQPLQQQLKDVEIRIQDKEDAIASTKMAILKHQERIEKILSGLDRVQSSHGKITIPSASQLMKQNMESSPFMEDTILIAERPTSSSTFGSALNRLSKSSAGIRPIFTESEDLDPDNFNPWKE